MLHGGLKRPDELAPHRELQAGAVTGGPADPDTEGELEPLHVGQGVLGEAAVGGRLHDGLAEGAGIRSLAEDLSAEHGAGIIRLNGTCALAGLRARRAGQGGNGEDGPEQVREKGARPNNRVHRSLPQVWATREQPAPPPEALAETSSDAEHRG